MISFPQLSRTVLVAIPFTLLLLSLAACGSLPPVQPGELYGSLVQVNAELDASQVKGHGPVVYVKAVPASHTATIAADAFAEVK